MLKIPAVRVNLSDFETAAKSVENYILFMNNKMQTINTRVHTLEWTGEDCTAFFEKWNEIISQGSRYQAMTSVLHGYANYLRTAAAAYKEAQEEAVRRANRL